MQYIIFAESLPACRRLRYSFNLKDWTSVKRLDDPHKSASQVTPVISWEKLAPELTALNQRLLLWQQQVKEELGKLLEPAKAAAGAYSHEEQHQALRQAMAKAGEGPRSELNEAMDQLCAFYLNATAGGTQGNWLILRRDS